jgi:hypothetical protein
MPRSDEAGKPEGRGKLRANLEGCTRGSGSPGLVRDARRVWGRNVRYICTRMGARTKSGTEEVLVRVKRYAFCTSGPNLIGFRHFQLIIAFRILILS